jgi:hypothetical protein
MPNAPLCRTCGETDPAAFPAYNQSRCLECYRTYQRTYRDRRNHPADPETPSLDDIAAAAAVTVVGGRVPLRLVNQLLDSLHRRR